VLLGFVTAVLYKRSKYPSVASRSSKERHCYCGRCRKGYLIGPHLILGSKELLPWGGKGDPILETNKWSSDAASLPP
jgi:hypothetical protein